MKKVGWVAGHSQRERGWHSIYRMPAYTQLLTAVVCCCGSDLPSFNHYNCSFTSIQTEAVVEPAYKLSCHHGGISSWYRV